MNDSVWGLIAIIVLGGLGTLVLMSTVVIYGVSKINYLLDEHYLRIRVGFLPVRKIAIEDFIDVEVGVSHGVESWANTLNRTTLKSKGITLFRRSGLFKKLILTPDVPKQFVQNIKQHPKFVKGVR